MNADLRAEIAAEAARWVVESGLEYAAAKSRAARALGVSGGRGSALPSDEEVEAAVTEHLAVFCAESQPAELAELRRVAERWMDRLAPWRPHLSGAAWRGTATRLSALRIDLYCDDPKSAPIELLNRGVAHRVDAVEEGSRDPITVLTIEEPSRALGGPVTVHLFVRDLDALKGALRPDSSGRTWRGDLTALRGRMASTGSTE